MADSRLQGGVVLTEMTDVFVISVGHRPDGGSGSAALRSAGLPAHPSVAGGLIPVPGGCFATLSPTRGILVTRARALSAKVIDALRPGLCDSAMAVDVSEGHSVLALSGFASERPLAAGTDSAVPVDITASACTCRVFDVKVTLLRFDRQSRWLVVESSLAGHLAAHLRQSIRTITQASCAAWSALAPTGQAP